MGTVSEHAVSADQTDSPQQMLQAVGSGALLASANASVFGIAFLANGQCVHHHTHGLTTITYLKALDGSWETLEEP